MKGKYLLFLGMAALLVLSGCTEAEGGSDYDYVPVGGQGCSFSAEYDNEEPVIATQEFTETFSFV